ncbi:potassium voltage-gated channel subfamily H member 1-like isoform X2 [Mya arenaria]|uniref:potassium voltage-gated channel subfamily H member 1-like isoform X2 n=1 Tax=Mya arenaria TaxID=6604 RepID=UPI0022E30901|nr:potassium voltage-gated channel subfamily H member 1-like isoform X2 [Mya arenaria]
MPGAKRGLVAPQNTFLENIIRRFSGQHSSFILANARIVDYPTVYCNDGFCKLSGYNRAEVMQKSSTCSFMYGDLTDKATIKKLEEAFENLRQEQVEILLYKKNRSPLWLLLNMAPIRNEKDQVILILCTFKDITALKQPIEDENARGMSKFARLARSVTRNRSTILQFSSSIPSMKFETSRPSQIANMMNLNAEVLPQYRLEAPKTPPHIILHYCLFKTIWDWVILVLTFYTAVTVPFNTAFRGKNLDQVPLLVMDSMVDVVFFVDIVLNFHTTFVGASGEVISDPKIIRMNYLKSWFVIDLLSCLPYDVFNAFQDVDEGISTLFSALKVVRLLRLGRVVRKLDHYLEYGAAMLVMLILVFCLFAHWFACIWYSVGNTEIKAGISYGWLSVLSNVTGEKYYFTNTSDEIFGGPGKGMKYLSALYFTLSCMTGVGFGNVSAATESEKLFSVFLMIIGSLLYATIFSNVTTIFQQFYASFARYHDMLNSVREFMKLHDVPKSLSERVMDYIVSTWAITKGIDAAKVLNYCPKDMKADLCVHLNRKVFLEHPAFRLASDGCLRALAMHFTMTHSAPGDLIFHQGESLDALCFVISGSLEVIQDDEVVAILSKGDVFGDNFWKEGTYGQSTANVRALTYCDLHTIKRERLLEVLEFYHAFANSFARNLTLTYNLRHRIIFRKVADVKKEKELAEKRKNDPPLELSNDHPVRKLISRFRKMGDTKGGGVSDLEKGGPKVFTGGERPSSGTTKVINVSENPNSSVVNSFTKIGGGASKWGKILGNSSGSGGGGVGEIKSNNVTAYKLPETSAQEEALKKASERKDSSHETSRSVIRNVAKLNRVLENHPPSIDESPEIEQKNNLKKTESLDSGILKSNKTLDQISNSSDGSQCSRHQHNGGALSAAEQQMLTSLYDIKLEFKEEMEIMHQKMNRIDEQVSEILRMFSPTASQCSSQSTSCVCPHGCSSKFTSPQNTTTNSVEHSPKTSVSSSPRRSSNEEVTTSSVQQSDLANMCDDVINMDIRHAIVHDFERPKKVLNQALEKVKSPKRNAIKHSQSSSTSNSPQPSESHTKPNKTKTNRVSPENPPPSGKTARKTRLSQDVDRTSPNYVEGPITTRDIDVPIKDQDLELL